MMLAPEVLHFFDGLQSLLNCFSPESPSPEVIPT